MRITVIGCGNSGLIHAAKLIRKGHEVALLKTSRHNDAFYEKIAGEQSYHVEDEVTAGGVQYVARPVFITRDVEKAVSFADALMVTTTTAHHEEVARLIAPYVREGQLIVLCPGYMGSLIFRRFIHKDVTYSEWETSAYNGRIMNNDFVRITFYNPHNAVSVLPLSRTQATLDILSSWFDNTRYARKHILESALHNPNMIVHPIGVIFSASRIEYSQGEFWMYREAFTDSVINVIKAFDKSKNRVLERFGCSPLDYFDAARWRNEVDQTKDAMEVFRSFGASSNKGPMSLSHRYLLEDIPMGVCLFESLARAIGEDASIQSSIITMGSALLNTDLRKGARTIEYLLQKDDVTFDDILKAITE